MDILVVLEEAQGSLHRLSKEAIVGAQELDGTVAALAIGKHCDQIASECSSYDLENVITVNHELISNIVMFVFKVKLHIYLMSVIFLFSTL